MQMDFHEIILSFSYVAIFVFMMTNGIINLPSSQLLYLVVGYFVGTGHINFFLAVFVGAVGNTLGNMITFFLVKKYGKSFAQKILFVNATTFNHIYEGLHDTFSKRGMWYIFFGKITPSIKAFIPMLAGLAKTNEMLTGILFFFSSFLWALAIITIGKEFGEHVSLSSLAVISFIVGSVILFIAYRNIHKKLQKNS
jgi:membrane protein DedA with SNARE-associated domain